MKAPMKSVLLATMLALATISGVGCAVTSGQSRVGEYVDDTVIATRVKARMAQNPDVSAMRIQVEVQDGTVQLAGFATSQAEKDRAGELARGVPEVKEVRNNIIVRPPS